MENPISLNLLQARNIFLQKKKKNQSVDELQLNTHIWRVDSSLESHLLIFSGKAILGLLKVIREAQMNNNNNNNKNPSLNLLEFL